MNTILPAARPCAYLRSATPARCRNVPQGIAAYRNTAQLAATHRNMPQRAATCCDVPQCDATLRSAPQRLQGAASCRNAPRRTATHCNIPKYAHGLAARRRSGAVVNLFRKKISSSSPLLPPRPKEGRGGGRGRAQLPLARAQRAHFAVEE